MMLATNSTDAPLFADEFRHELSENGTCWLPIDAVAVMISCVSIYSFLMAASLVGNSLLIFAYVKTKITTNLIIANIAVSDMLFSIVGIPREISVQIEGSTAFVVHGWIGSLLCKICAFVTDLSIAVSTLSLVLITVDRFVAVVLPMKYSAITAQKWRFFTLSTWILAMAIHSPYFYTFRLNEKTGETFCITNWEPAFDHESTHTRYYTALLITVLIVPLVAVSILQVIILVNLRNDKMAAFRTSIAIQRNKIRNKKLLKMSAAIFLAFALCWLPLTVLQFLHLNFSNSIPRCSLSFAIFGRFAILLSLCHCIMNPCICFTFMRRIRAVLRRTNRGQEQTRTQLTPRVYQETRL